MKIFVRDFDFRNGQGKLIRKKFIIDGKNGYLFI